jgi:Fe2+ transport system protein FeoA
MPDMSLAMTEPGRLARVVAIRAGKGLISRLASMGIATGSEVEVIQNSLKGPFIIGLKGTRIMLGKGVAHKILVE